MTVTSSSLPAGGLNKRSAKDERKVIPSACKTIASEAMACPERGRFQCSRISRCPARAPMYMAVSHTIYQR